MIYYKNVYPPILLSWRGYLTKSKTVFFVPGFKHFISIYFCSKVKRKSSKNFGDGEKTVIKKTVSKYPIIENKRHESLTENKKGKHGAQF